MEGKDLQLPFTVDDVVDHQKTDYVDHEAANTFDMEEENGAASAVNELRSEELLQIKHSLKLLTTAVNTILKNQEVYNTGLLDLQTSTEFIRSSLKILEVVMCENGSGSKHGGRAPTLVAAHYSGKDTVEKDAESDKAKDADGVMKRKSPYDDNNEDVNNVDLTISDDEDDNNRGKKICNSDQPMTFNITVPPLKPQLPLAWTQTVGSATKNESHHNVNICGSNFRRTSGNPGKHGEFSGIGLTQISKRLFETPSPTPHLNGNADNLSGQHVVPSVVGRFVNGSSSKKKKSDNEEQKSVQKSNPNLLPKGIKWKFRITLDMHLDLSERKICAYVFHPSKPSGEVLVRSRGIFATRGDFHSLSPGNKVNEEIISLVAERITWVQKEYERCSVWTLPPSFAEDTLLGFSPYELTERYGMGWMEPYPKLKYIYVPIKTHLDHWFLMVVSIQDEIVYHVDSFCKFEDVAPRRDTIRILCKVLQQMVSSTYYGSAFIGTNMAFTTYQIDEPRGISNFGPKSSENSGVWVIEWMDLEQCFSRNLFAKLKENKVRIRTCLTLLLGMYNDERAFLEEKANAFWGRLTP